jgi:hypothetical protein
MKTYSTVSEDVERILTSVRDEYHSPDLDGVTVSALFVYDMDGTESVLKLGGYPCQAVVNITPLKQRALGVSDAVIVIDRSNWLGLTVEQRHALIDHELYHIERVGEDGAPEMDAIDRPKLKMRRHDHQIGMFTEILRRHGKHSAEHRMVRAVWDEAGQMLLDIGPAPKTQPSNVRQLRAAEAR